MRNRLPKLGIVLFAIALAAPSWAATYFRTVSCEVQASEATAAKATLYYEVGTHEAQTITVSKAGGAFGATAGTTGTQVDGTLYKLTLHASDIDTEGDVAFKSAGATDTQYIIGIRVVDHDPFDAVAEILDDTGTSGVVLGADAITAAKIGDAAFSAEHFSADSIVAATLATGAITADAFAADAIVAATLATGAITADAFAADAIVAATLATDAITADALAATATAEIADAVWEEDLGDHDGTADSVAETLRLMAQRLCGKIVTDNGDGTIKVYDTDGTTLLLTITKGTSGDEVTWTPG